MKLSKYLTFLNINGNTIIYNALSQKCTVVKNYVLNRQDLSDEFLSKNKNFEDELMKAGSLIEDENEEKSMLQSMMFKSQNNHDEFILHINPTLDCNLNCWYCYETKIKKSEMSINTAESIIKFVKDLIRDKKITKIQLGFFGGEPLMKFNSTIKFILENIKEICMEGGCYLNINFTSNGTLLNNSIIEYLSNFNCGFQITIDGDADKHGKTRFLGGGNWDIPHNN